MAKTLSLLPLESEQRTHLFVTNLWRQFSCRRKCARLQSPFNYLSAVFPALIIMLNCFIISQWLELQPAAKEKSKHGALGDAAQRRLISDSDNESRWERKHWWGEHTKVVCTSQLGNVTILPGLLNMESCEQFDCWSCHNTKSFRLHLKQSINNAWKPVLLRLDKTFCISPLHLPSNQNLPRKGINETSISKRACCNCQSNCNSPGVLACMVCTFHCAGVIQRKQSIEPTSIPLKHSAGRSAECHLSFVLMNLSTSSVENCVQHCMSCSRLSRPLISWMQFSNLHSHGILLFHFALFHKHSCIWAGQSSCCFKEHDSKKSSRSWIALCFVHRINGHCNMNHRCPSLNATSLGTTPWLDQTGSFNFHNAFCPMCFVLLAGNLPINE